MTQRPEYLTVPEVMARLRLGRTTVYEQARLYLATGGVEGIPCRRFGRSLRFPAAAFDAVGNAAAGADGGAKVIDLAPRPVDRETSTTRPSARRTRRTRRATSSTAQSPPPFAD